MTFSYDGNGNLHIQHDKTGTTTYTYDARNRQTQKQLPSTATLQQTYDSAGNVATYVDAGGTVTYTYNAANQLTKLAEPGGSCTGTISLCTTFTYDNNGKRLTTTYPGSTVMTSTLDNSGRPTEVKTVNGATTLTDYRYTYTKAGSDTELTQTRTDTAGLVTTYGYDARNDLLSAIEKNGGTTTAAWTYCIDAAGNRTGVSTATSASPACTTSPTTSYTYNNANELTAATGPAPVGPTTPTATKPPATAPPRAARRPTPRPTSSPRSPPAAPATAMTYAGLTNDERVTAGSTSSKPDPKDSPTKPSHRQQPAGPATPPEPSSRNGPAAATTTTSSTAKAPSSPSSTPRAPRSTPTATTPTASPAPAPAPPPTLPLHRRLQRRHRPVPPRRPLLRPQPRPLHPTRPRRTTTKPLRIRRRRSDQQQRPHGTQYLGRYCRSGLITVAVVAVGALLSTGFGEIAAGELLFGSADIAAAGPIGTGLTFGGYYSITGT